MVALSTVPVPFIIDAGRLGENDAIVALPNSQE